MSLETKPTVVLYQPRKDDGGAVNAPPYALLALAAVLVNEFHVMILDGALSPDPWDEIAAVSGASGILAFGVTVMTGPPIRDARMFSREAQRLYPSIPVVWGGCHPSVDPEGTLRDGCADFVVRGQGEVPFLEFLRKIRDGIPTDDIPGLGFLIGDEFHQLPQIHPRKLGCFPRRPFELVDLKRYVRDLEKIGRSIVYISSQGCTYKCDFCSDTMLYGSHWSGYSVDQMLADVRMLCGLGVSFLMIFDNNFFVSRSRTLDFCRRVRQEGLAVRWQADICVDQILMRYSPEDLAEIRNSGGEVFFVGAESGNNEVLGLLNKGISRDDTIAAARKCRDAGIRVIYSFMTGFPELCREEFRDTISLCNELLRFENTEELLLCTYTPYPGTVLFDKFAGLFNTPKTLLGWSDWSVFSVKGNWIDPVHQDRIRNAETCLSVVCGFFPWVNLQTLARKNLLIRAALGCFQKAAAFRLRHQCFRFFVEKRVADLVEKMLRKFGV